MNTDPRKTLPVHLQQQEPLIRDSCSQCHYWTPPDILPRNQWRRTIDKMYKIANEQLLLAEGRAIKVPMRDVVNYFEALAPETLQTPPWGPGGPHPTVRHDARRLTGLSKGGAPSGVSNVRLIELFDDLEGPELVVCDMFSRWIAWARPASQQTRLQRLATLSHPAHAEAVDLDRDGRTDLLVAELGAPMPTDSRLGSVAWLRRTDKRTFQVVRLASNLGRVADARAADFDEDGDLDIVVAEFGWIEVGSVLYLENRAEPGAAPRFVPRTLDERKGAIHVPIVDLDRDGHKDFVALFAQENESVNAFLNRGGGRFEEKELWAAPHPHWGFTGIEPVDLDQDGDLDFLLTNGDTLDDRVRFKPYQGVAWLENLGALVFEHHFIGPYYGAHRAQAGDVDGDGDLDIVAASFLPGLPESERQSVQLPRLVWYEQVGPRSFQGRPLHDGPCDHATLDLGDLNGDGRVDVVTGIMQAAAPGVTETTAVEIWLSQ